VHKFNQRVTINFFPESLVGWGEGYFLPIPLPVDACGASPWVWGDCSKDLGVETPLNNAVYRTQVNLHGSLCIIAVFLYCYGHRKKTKISTECTKIRHFDLKALPPPQTSPLRGEGHPLPTPHPTWHLQRLDSTRIDLDPPISTPGSAYVILYTEMV